LSSWPSPMCSIPHSRSWSSKVARWMLHRHSSHSTSTFRRVPCSQIHLRMTKKRTWIPDWCISKGTQGRLRAIMRDHRLTWINRGADRDQWCLAVPVWTTSVLNNSNNSLSWQATPPPSKSSSVWTVWIYQLSRPLQPPLSSLSSRVKKVTSWVS
jgi:hypothetical protein